MRPCILVNKAMASSTPSQPLHHFPLPPLSLCNNISVNNNGVISDIPVTADPSMHEKPSESNKKKPKIVLKFRRLKDKPSIMAEENGSEATTSKEHLSCLKVIERQPDDDQNNKIVPQLPKKPSKKKEKKRIRLVSKEDIEEDIAAIEALTGVKRLRRPKKRNNVDQKQLDRLIPGLEYIS